FRSWGAALSAATGFCNPNCFYDAAVAIDPRTSGAGLRVFLGGSADSAPRRMVAVSNDNGASFTADDTGLHADTHVIVVDSSTNPSTVWVGSDGGVWKGLASMANTWTDLNTSGLGTIQIEI